MSERTAELTVVGERKSRRWAFLSSSPSGWRMAGSGTAVGGSGFVLVLSALARGLGALGPWRHQVDVYTSERKVRDAFDLRRDEGGGILDSWGLHHPTLVRDILRLLQMHDVVFHAVDPVRKRRCLDILAAGATPSAEQAAPSPSEEPAPLREDMPADVPEDGPVGAAGASGASDEAPVPASSHAAPGRILAFTDGGSRGNPGPGGWAFLLLDRVSGRSLERWGAEERTTNNRMEYTAAIEVLKSLKGKQEVELRTDSRLLLDTCTRWMAGWKRRGWSRAGNLPVANLDLVKELDRLLSKHTVRWTWVRGHAGNPGNERVDRLVNAAMDRLAAGHDASGELRYEVCPIRP
jgi:ribonuclease HI